ncbi:MAG: zinc ribbon domain-containing protein [Gemmatimonadales bacterium]
MSRASALLSLQQIDDRIATLTHDIGTVEASLRGDPELDRLRATESAAHEEHRTLGASARLAELEAASLHARIRELDRRLYSGTVRNPAELMEMQRELEGMRTRLSTAEDDALERMEQVDRALADLESASAGVAAREVQRSNAMEPMRARLEALTAERDVLSAERDALRANVDPADLSLYARIAAHRRPAVTGLAGEFCAGCHMPVSNEERRAVRTGTGLTQCAKGDRILAP